MGIGQKTTQKEISMFSIHIGLKYIYYILTHKKKIIDSMDDKFEEARLEKSVKQSFASSISSKLLTELTINQ